MQQNPSLDLVEFVETQILPQYAQFDKAHNMEHVIRVIRRSLDLARKIGADLDMAYTIAAYHDLGLTGPRAIHHITSGKMLMQDARLKHWFSPEQLRMMKEAVEDHRASASRAPRSIYGKIVAEADRDIDPETVIRRTIQFGLSNYPEMDTEGHWKRFMQHMDEKYSVNGYIRLWIQGSENEHKLNELRRLITNSGEMRTVFDRIFKEENK
ncbi:MAG: HD domain-containing protein [Prevotella sp.]|nr:HD domain-containing protein [Prevotella sp.]